MQDQKYRIVDGVISIFENMMMWIFFVCLYMMGGHTSSVYKFFLCSISTISPQHL